MGKIDLEDAFSRLGALAKNLQDQARTIQYFRIPGLFEIALLDRGKRAVYNDKVNVFVRQPLGDFLNFPRAKQRRGMWARQPHDIPARQIQIQRVCETFTLGKAACFGRRIGTLGRRMQD